MTREEIKKQLKKSIKICRPVGNQYEVLFGGIQFDCIWRNSRYKSYWLDSEDNSFPSLKKAKEKVLNKIDIWLDMLLNKE